MSISPEIGKQNRPFVGIVVICGAKQYCIPLLSPKPKHISMKNSLDFMKIVDKNGKLIDVLNLNNMIPVNDTVIYPIDMVPSRHDNARTRKCKGLLNDQLDWCNTNSNIIVRKANRLYELVTMHPERSRSLVKRCCNYKKLETLLKTHKPK